MDFLKRKLDQRKEEGNLRSLSLGKGSIDFFSNDYLGLARNENLKYEIEKELQKFTELLNGSTGSRLLSGNSVHVEGLEKYLAEY